MPFYVYIAIESPQGYKVVSSSPNRWRSKPGMRLVETLKFETNSEAYRRLLELREQFKTFNLDLDANYVPRSKR